MAKKRAKVNTELFSGSDDLFWRTEDRAVAAPKKATTRQRLEGRATYDIGAELKEAIREESVRLGVPASQLARYLLLLAWNDYMNGDIAPPTLLPSQSPAYRNVVQFPE